MSDVGQFNNRTSEHIASICPIYAKDEFKGEKGLLKWVGQYLPVLEQIHEPRIRRMNHNLCWYLNEISSMNSPRFMLANRQVMPIPLEAVPILISHLYDLTESRVSKLSLYKASFDVVPTHIEDSDKISARLLKPCLDAIARINSLDFLIQEAERWCGVFGEVFFKTEWDENMGDRDDKGVPVGDVRLSVKEPYWIMYEPKRDWKKVGFLLEIDDVLHLEEARLKYKMPSLEPDNTSSIYGFQNDLESTKASDELVIYKLTYKPCEGLPNGLVAKIAGNEVLEFETKKYPYSHNDFEYDRHTDIDVPGRVFPISFYNYLIPMQHAYNKMTALIHRNIVLCSHPKWIAQKGSVSLQSLGNTAGIAWYNPGTTPPRLEAYNSVPQDIYRHREDMRNEMQTISGTQGISRGTPPPGARAASMLKFYEEQETQRQSTKISKHNSLIVNVMTKAAGVVGDKYPIAPERLVRTVGKFNQYDIRRLQQVKISSNYEILIQNSTGFSETKSGRIEEVGFLQEKVPGYLSPEQIADILGHATPQKAYDIITAALKLAEKENQDMMEGIPVASPMPWEDHFIHWKTHVIFMQTETFKRLPKMFQQYFVEHVEVHEMQMDEMANNNDIARQMLQGLPNYPIFWKANLPPIQSQQPQQAPEADPQVPVDNTPTPTGQESGEESYGAEPMGEEAPTAQDLQPMEQ